MSIWSEVRRQARLRHESLANSNEDLVPADELLAAAEAATAVTRQARPAGDALLDGACAVYHPEHRRIYYSDETEPRLASFQVAHEYAHHWLDEAMAGCSADDLDLETPAEPEMSLVGEADAYSPKERVEAQANLFAREFLLPRDKLRRHCNLELFDAERLASHVGVPVELVMQQLADALLLPEDPLVVEGGREEPPPDDTQTAAINAAPGPHRVRAGPGTGKTRTLVGKIKRLVENGEAPRSILVLTFSNFSAQDLAARIRAALGDRAPAIWIGTFHAFGLEILRKHGPEIGLPVDIRLLDRSSSLMLLEELLPQLGLDHYLDLFDPLLKLRSVLTLISRAKDELVTPAGYAELARAMQGDGDAKEREAREKALEVAHAYEVYERTLRERGFVDFGDLIARPVELLRTRPDVRDIVRSERRHILVDEYQDMNRASGLFLGELVTPGLGPWVVGDVRQSIYRFRGASPLNMARFAEDFPGAKTTDLGVNYRSGGRIIRTFETFGTEMMSGELTPPIRLEAHRGEAIGRLDFDIAATFDAECEGIGRKILAHVKHGGAFGDYAILARSHGTLSKLARHLERAGVPCLYFGDFFERPEIRDLLSLLSVVSEWAGVGLFRVGRLPQYAVPYADLSAIFRWRREQNISMLATLRRLPEISDLSPTGRESLQRVADDVVGATYPISAHRFLLRHLFMHGDHLEPVLADRTVTGQQRRLAIYQLLQFAFSFRASRGTDPKRAFLEHVRRLEMLDEEKQLRQLPAASGQIDAVRMMTVHASKGLQFRAVHIPSVTSRHFPVNRSDVDHPPPGLISDDLLMRREAEEESLFFVAISRAEDTLGISRAIKYGGGAWSAVKPSTFLERIRQHLPASPDASPTWKDEGTAEPNGRALQAPQSRDVWPAHAIEAYIECPRRFYYGEVLQLGTTESGATYRRFNSALRASIEWLHGALSPEERRVGALARLEYDWEQSGLKGHAFEGIYRAAAERMLATAERLVDGTILPADVTLNLGENLTVTCRADQVSLSSEGVVVRRLKTGRLSKDEKTKARYAIMQTGLSQQNPGVSVQFEHVSLLTGEQRRATFSSSKLPVEIAKIETAFAGIGAGRFDPTPNDFKCPRCPYYFICPTDGAAPDA